MTTKAKHLYYLNELKDYKIKKNDPDIRGWQVKDLDNRVVGKVDNLLVNKELGKVVYVDVEVDQSIIDANHDPYAAPVNTEVREFINKEGENHIIIPIGLISLNRDDKYIFTESINYRTFAETKRYRSGTSISRDYEHHVLGSYNRDRNYTEEELRKTRSAYTDAELEEKELRRREEERLAEERRRDLEYEDQVREKPVRNPDEKIRGKKENLRYKSDREREISDNYNRDTGYHRDNENDLQPVRTLDDDSSWEHENRKTAEEDLYRNKQWRNKRVTDEFYDRKEFHERDSR